jgi:serralysin
MSYTREPSYIGANPDDGLDPDAVDIKAIQYLYGANTAAAAGNDTYVFDPVSVQFRSFWDAGGIDTFDASRHMNAVTINLNPGSFSTISTPFRNGAWTVDGVQYTQALDNVSIAYNTIIENASGGSGNDTITGNAVSNHLVGNAGDNRLYGMDGDDYLVGGQGNDTLDGGNGFDIALFGDSPVGVTVDLASGYAVSAWGGRDALVSIEGAAGTAKADIFIGTGGNNQFFGGEGDDTVVYNGGADWFDGGAGRDLVTGFGLRHEYATFFFGGGNGTVGGQSTGNVEKFVFADGYLVTDTADTAAQVYRLYGATLDRAPDLGGLRSWTTAVERKALTLAQATDGFTGSAEFQGKYGSLDNAGFVKLLYANVLDREADAGGLNGGMSQSQVVLDFSESADNVARTSADVLKGLWISDDRAAQVARMFDTTLDRQGDAPGIKGWLGALNGGMTLKQMADGFTGSAEFQGKYGALDDLSFVRQLYRNVLYRDGEEAGVQAWHGGLKGGMGRSDIVVGFSESAEHMIKIKLAGLTDDGIHFYA